MAKFLIIDDSKFARTILKNILAEAGHEIIAEAANGLEGEVMYAQHKPDIVTLDNVMPEEGGKDCLTHIMEKHPDAKIIMVSSVGKDNLIDEELKIGAKAFIVKPFEKENVLSVVNKILEE
jgi:two-component system chemotaxis response regulator CheY